MEFNAHADVVVVKVEHAEEKTGTGLYIPNEAIKPQNIGEIVAIGQGKVATANGALIPTSHKVGEKIMFIDGAGTKVTLEDKEYRVMRESDIIGVWR